MAVDISAPDAVLEIASQLGVDRSTLENALQSPEIKERLKQELEGAQRDLYETVRNSIGAGQALRQNQLLAPLVVQQGQQVIVRFVGDGFSASAEGQALNKAATGEAIRRLGEIFGGSAKDSP